jgi:hypothetical protein
VIGITSESVIDIASEPVIDIASESVIDMPRNTHGACAFPQTSAYRRSECCSRCGDFASLPISRPVFTDRFGWLLEAQLAAQRAVRKLADDCGRHGGDRMLTSAGN